MTAPRVGSRREALKVAALGASGVATALAATRAAGIGVAADANPHDAPDNTTWGEDPPAPPTYLAELAGVELGDYRVVSVHAFHRGGVPVELSYCGGAPFRVDVLRADRTAGASGIGAVLVHSVYLRNGGNGRTATDERMGLGAMALADELARRVQAGLVPPAELLTMEERAALHASAALVT